METSALDKTEITVVPRGVTPTILIEQIRNTLPFLFLPQGASLETAWHLRHLREVESACRAGLEPAFTHDGYFRLCAAAHWATVASFVPTDVDNQIRFKLWHPSLPTETVRAMTAVVTEAGTWDWSTLQARRARSPASGERMSGHNGEWFSMAAAAYGALRRRSPEEAAAVAGNIVREVRREIGIFADLRQARDGIGLMKASVVIAHNLGDLQRVFEMWNITTDDPLAEAVEKIKAEREQIQSAEINRRWMATENHRHFALRGPRALRRSAEFFLPLGPFFDEWGQAIARRLEPEDTAEVTEALIDGWRWLEGKAVGYCRALAGIEEGFPGGMNKLAGYLPAKIAREWKTGAIRTACAVPRRRFEDQWKQMALNACR